MLVTLLGHPVAHSLSPKMHNAAFAAVGLDRWRYEAWETPHDEVPTRMAEIRRRDDVAGANVTVPHKQAVVALVDELSEAARAIGAVNTIVKRDGRLVGHNTDATGFMADLRWHGMNVSDVRRAVVLGAGGSARAVVYALATSGADVGVFNRSGERAQQLVASLALPRLSRLTNLSDLGRCDLIVNSTSAGMWPNDDISPWPDGLPFPAGATLYDLVYRPRATKFMRDAERAGLRVVGGVGMLAEQGAAAFELWTGVASERVSGLMRAALAQIC